MTIERDTIPRPWPFLSPLGTKPGQAMPEAKVPESTNVYCTCDNELTLQEIDTGKCSACGGVLCA